MLNIEVVSFATAALFFISLSLVLMTGQRGQPQKRLLAIATLSSGTWAGVVAYQAAYGGLVIIAQLLELLRELTWFAFLLLLLKTAYNATKQVVTRFWITLGIISAFTAALMLLALYRISGGSALELIAGNDVLSGHLLMAVGGLVIVEQLYRNTPAPQRRAIKYLCLAIGGMFAYDFYLYSDALLFQRVSAVLWDARGFIHAMVVPVIGVAISRNLQWTLKKDAIDAIASSRMIFHTTALLGAGLYLIAMGTGGYYVRVQGGTWGLVAQAIFLFGAGLVLSILLFSGQLRASLRIFIRSISFIINMITAKNGCDSSAHYLPANLKPNCANAPLKPWPRSWSARAVFYGYVATMGASNWRHAGIWTRRFRPWNLRMVPWCVFSNRMNG